jgi:hypothetical protein
LLWSELPHIGEYKGVKMLESLLECGTLLGLGVHKRKAYKQTKKKKIRNLEQRELACLSGDLIQLFLF